MTSLFDDLEEDNEPELADWQEVPQARFLSWSPAMQEAYCRRRDLDSAVRSEEPWWQKFYLERAEIWL
jgi:hypothetical protein